MLPGAFSSARTDELARVRARTANDTARLFILFLRSLSSRGLRRAQISAHRKPFSGLENPLICDLSTRAQFARVDTRPSPDVRRRRRHDRAGPSNYSAISTILSTDKDVSPCHSCHRAGLP